MKNYEARISKLESDVKYLSDRDKKIDRIIDWLDSLVPNKKPESDKAKASFERKMRIINRKRFSK